MGWITLGIRPIQEKSMLTAMPCATKIRCKGVAQGKLAAFVPARERMVLS